MKIFFTRLGIVFGVWLGFIFFFYLTVMSFYLLHWILTSFGF